ncbi:MAG TPA: hypothetical protein VLL52_12630 [Anaerolineae bacterium]|nr:hypothetical protein [Anaerolineae bacterium]
MYRLNSSIEQRLASAQTIIENSLNIPTILDTVTTYGYDENKLRAAHNLYLTAAQQTRDQIREYGEKYAATEKAQTSWQQAKATYTNTLKLARLAFKDNTEASNTLLLTGKREPSFAGWTHQVQTFYQNLLANPAYLATMSRFNYDETKLKAEYTLVQNAIHTRQLQDQERAEAHLATQTRDTTLGQLDDWMQTYTTVLRIAFTQNPQWLEALGISA